VRATVCGVPAGVSPNPRLSTEDWGLGAEAVVGE
jgi:hypothetical protein